MDTKTFFQGNIFKIVAKHSGKVLDIPGAQKLEDHVKLMQWDDLGGDNQKFLIFPMDDVGKYFVIATLASGKVLDMPNSSNAESMFVIQHYWHGGDNQLFELEAVSNDPNNDTFYIRSKASGKILGVADLRYVLPP